MGQVIRGTLPAQTALGADSTTYLGMASTETGTDNFVQRATLIPPVGFTTVTHSGTDNVTFTVKLKRAGTAVDTNVASFQSTATDLTAETEVPMTVNTATPWEVKQGDEFECTMHQTGSTGVAVSAGIDVEIELN